MCGHYTPASLVRHVVRRYCRCCYLFVWSLVFLRMLPDYTIHNILSGRGHEWDPAMESCKHVNFRHLRGDEDISSNFRRRTLYRRPCATQLGSVFHHASTTVDDTQRPDDSDPRCQVELSYVPDIGAASAMAPQNKLPVKMSSGHPLISWGDGKSIPNNMTVSILQFTLRRPIQDMCFRTLWRLRTRS